MVLALPVLAIPAILRGGVERDLVGAAVAGLVVFVLLFIVGVVLLSSERPLRWVGRLVQRVRNRLRRRAEPLRELPDRLVRERRPHPRHARPALEARAGRGARALGL